MTPFIGLTRAGTTREVRVNPAAIAYVDLVGGAGAVIAFSGGAQLLVAETPEVVERRVASADAFEVGPLPADELEALCAAGPPAVLLPAASPTRRTRSPR